MSGSIFKLNPTAGRLFLANIILFTSLTTAGVFPAGAQLHVNSLAYGSGLATPTPLLQVRRDSLNALAAVLLSERGEVYFRFPVQSPVLTDKLSCSLSVDKVEGGHVYAYAGSRQFKKFLDRGIIYELLPPPSSRPYLRNEGLYLDPATYNSYPSYNEYVEQMLVFADSFPGICRIDTIGYSVNNRLLLAAGISGSSSFRKGKPVFLYTATIHGDETTGYMLLLRLIDELLHGYGKESFITQLVDQLEIWINPLANPDGTYFLGGANVYMATRLNANAIDLNRNFPDPADGDHPDGEEWQPETLAMMEFMRRHPTDMSANLHSGAEVVNYPWDTWWVLHADEDWFRMISKNYADTVISNSAGYFQQFRDGVTRGIDWYRVNGGRQDYVTYFLHGREVTLELSLEKMPPPGDLPLYWEYNRKAMLHLMEQCLFGIAGEIVDSRTGKPVMAKISIPGHDTDNSIVYSDSLTGNFSRFLKEGNYIIHAEAPGYKTATIEQVQVLDGRLTTINIDLEPEATGIRQDYRQADLTVAGTRIIYYIEQAATVTMHVFDLTGRQILPSLSLPSSEGWNEVEAGDMLTPGIYLFRITFGSRSFSYICSFNF